MAPSSDVVCEPGATLWWGRVLRSWWFRCALVLALLVSPMLFLSGLVLGGLPVAVGIPAWVRARSTIAIALGAGLMLGSLPYGVAAVLRLMGLR